MHRALFICSANKLRSPTAEHVCAQWKNVETDSAGLDARADVRLSPEQLDWASIIFVMERKHHARLSSEYQKHLKGSRVICLDIPDKYTYLQPDLVTLLESRLRPFLS